MTCIKYIGEEKFLSGLKELEKQLNFRLSDEGKVINFKCEKEGIHIVFDKDSAKVTYGKDSEFFRAFSLALQYLGNNGKVIDVKCDFNRFGTMQNCSNKVLNVDCVKELIRQHALMGYNYLELYTEVTYEVPDEPYFGYMKGRYSQSELIEIVEYGKKFCVELVPCIQTLGHMQSLFKWGYYYQVKDIERSLLVDFERTYILIENMLKSLKECFDTDRINLGMDEAYWMGLGRYHWFVNGSNPDQSMLFITHLKRVLELAEKYGFTKPAIWFDNLFGMEFKGYINPPVWLFKDFSDEIRKAFPEVQLIFWNYVLTDKYEFTRIVKMIRQLGDNISFASMAHGYTSFAPDNHMSEKLVDTVHEGCLENDIDDIMITWWGSVQSPLALLPSYYNFMEKCSTSSGYDFEDRCEFLFGYKYSEFIQLDLPNILEENIQSTGMAEGKNPAYYILAEDPLLGIMSDHIPDNAKKLYADYSKKLSALSKKESMYSYIFRYETVLCELLQAKCDFAKKLRKAYTNKNIQELIVLANYVPFIIEKTEDYYKAYRDYWTTFNKSIGWEVWDNNIGGQILRLKNIRDIILNYTEGIIDKIDELEQGILPVSIGNEGKTISMSSWRFASTSEQ